jgi:hypothetical protein
MKNMRSVIIAAALGTAGLSAALVPTLAAEMSGPTVSITSPTAGSTITSTDIPVTIEVQNFRLECADAGKSGRPGQGHVHVMLDGMAMAALTNVECGEHLAIAGKGIKPGQHTITVGLASDDHMPASMPVSLSFTYQPATAQALPAPYKEGQPAISIVSPSSGATVDKRFTLVVRVNNFRLSHSLEGKADVAGYGHLHVLVNQQGVTDQKPHDMAVPMSPGMPKMEPMIGMISMPGTVTVPVDLSTWVSGTAHITVMLAANDHMPAGAIAATVTVQLR